MTKKSTAQPVFQKPEEFFKDLVSEAMGRQKVKTQPETEFYLVNLLIRFISSESLFARDETGAYEQKPLAFMIKEALETADPSQQRKLFTHAGDVSLYTAGYFQDSLNRKLVDVDYYIDMGGAAYRSAAARADEALTRNIYEELANRFGSFVDVLAEVSDKTTPRTEKDLLRLYETWMRTGSERAAKALQEAGIFPNAQAKAKKDWTQ